MSRREGIQFAVGESAGLRGSIYAVWFGPRDIYIAKNDLYEDWKASIHYDRPGRPGRVRYTGITTAFAKRYGLSTSRQDRATNEWSGRELRPGSDVSMEFRLRIPESELRRLGTDDLKPLNAGDSLDIHWLPAPPPGGASEVSIISGPPTHVGDRPRRDDFADVLMFERQLTNCRRVWMSYHYIPAPSAADLRRYRRQVGSEIGRRKYRRFVAAMDCGDGTSAFAEFTTDYGTRQSAASSR